MFSINWYIRIMALMGILIFWSKISFAGLTTLNTGDIFQHAWQSAAFLLVIHYIFEHFLWKLKPLRWFLIKVPNLQGTWKGELVSKWADPQTGEEFQPVDIIVFIRQSFSTISVEVHTDKMESISYLAGFKTNKETGTQELCYTFSSKAFVATRETNPWHDGTAKFSIIEGTDIILDGEYWTARKTIGTITLRRLADTINRSILVS